MWLERKASWEYGESCEAGARAGELWKCDGERSLSISGEDY